AGLSPDTTGGHGGGHPGRGGASRRGGAAEPRQDAAQRIRAGGRVREWEGEMKAKTGKDGDRRGRAGKVMVGVVAIGAGLLAAAPRPQSSPVIPRLAPSDIHAEYVKVPSG